MMPSFTSWALVALLVASPLCLLPAEARSWDYASQGYTSKTDVVARATADPTLASFASSSSFSTVRVGGIGGMTGGGGVQPGGSVYLAQQIGQFNDWASAMGYTFTSAQSPAAFVNFAANMALIFKINTDPSVKWWASANKFANLSHAQFTQAYLMPASSARRSSGTGTKSFPTTSPQSNTNVDWLASGMVTPIRNQGSCGE